MPEDWKISSVYKILGIVVDRSQVEIKPIGKEIKRWIDSIKCVMWKCGKPKLHFFRLESATIIERYCDKLS